MIAHRLLITKHRHWLTVACLDVQAWCHKWEAEIEVSENPRFGLQPLPAQSQRMTASEKTLYDSMTHAKRSLEAWQAWMTATAQQVGNPEEWQDDKPPTAMNAPPLLLTMKKFPEARHKRQPGDARLSDHDVSRLPI